MDIHPKAKGDLSTLAIMAVLQDSGCSVFTPFGENTRCDLVIERDGELRRVQCKTGALRAGAIVFSVCSCYGHHRNPQKARRSYVGEVDDFAVFCRETSEAYLVPIDCLPSRSSAYLRFDAPQNNQRRRVRMAADYAIGRVIIEGLREPSDA